MVYAYNVSGVVKSTNFFHIVLSIFIDIYQLESSLNKAKGKVNIVEKILLIWDKLKYLGEIFHRERGFRH